MIGGAQGKTGQLDASPTWIVKEFRTLLSPFTAQLFNESLATGCFPQQYKHAAITPLLKQSNMYVSLQKSFRPYSNSPFLSKLLERAVHSLHAFPDASAMPAYHSARNKRHGTETTLIKVHNDL